MKNSTLKSNDLFVINPGWGQIFSVTGLQFMADMIAQSARSVDLDPSKMMMGLRVAGLWVAYPSINNMLVASITITDGHLVFMVRAGETGRSNLGRWAKRKLLLTDPNLIGQFGTILLNAVPWDSKFMM